MKRFATTLAVLSILVLATSAFGQNRYGWTISNSSTNPLANTGTATGGVGTLYLWFNCSTTDGMSAAEFDLQSVGITHLSTTAQNGYLNAGLNFFNILMAVGGCPTGPIVAATMLTLDNPGTMTIIPSAAKGTKGTVDCQPLPGVWPIDHTGYDNTGAPAPDKGQQCPPDAVEETSWGSLKSLYR